MSTAISRSLVFEAPGVPAEALTLVEKPVPAASDLQNGQILVKILAAPINPSDINTVEGKYPLVPKLPGVPGNEGVGRVEAMGPEVQGLAVGDYVIPVGSCQGTWRTHATVAANAWHKVSSSLPIETACALSINPPTAILLLRTFVDLKPGDVVIQNGANSVVGKYVIQLGKNQGLKTVNVVRERSSPEENAALAAELEGLGATLVTTPEKLRADLKASGLPAPKLALDCVGGEVATAVAKTLEHGGTMVTYGAMSKKPLTIPPSLLIFKDLKFKGFWVSGGFARDPEGAQKKTGILDEVSGLFQSGVLTPPPVKKIHLEDWQQALELLAEGRLNTKIVFANED